MAALFTPLMRFYQLLLWPVARPTAWMLDRWLGGEAIPFFRERDLHQLIRLHMESSETEIDRVEGRGAMNFLTLDDVPLGREGERPLFPPIHRHRHDPFLCALEQAARSVRASERARERRPGLSLARSLA
jgi:metal transporter CNNM